MTTPLRSIGVFILAFAASFILLSEAAFAAGGQGFSVGLPFVYKSNETCTNGSCSDGSGLYYDFKFGHTWASGLYLGAIYSDRTAKLGDNDIGWTSYGVSLGFNGSTGWYFHASYLLSAEYQLGSTERTDGSGIQVDAGYLHYFNSTFALGPQLTYADLETKKQNDADFDYSETDIFPQIALNFSF